MGFHVLRLRIRKPERKTTSLQVSSRIPFQVFAARRGIKI